MGEALPHTEMLAPRAGLAETLAHAREHVELRLGYEVELALLEPIDRGGQMNLRAYWRRKTVKLPILSRALAGASLTSPSP